MPPEDRRPRTQTGQGGIDAVWHAITADRRRADDRFDSLAEAVDGVKEDVASMRRDLKELKDLEARRTTSMEKRNHRIWQVASGVLVSLTVAAVVGLFTIFAPIITANMNARAPRVIDLVDLQRKDPGR